MSNSVTPKRNAKKKKKKSSISKIIIFFVVLNIVLVGAILTGYFFNILDFKDVRDFVVPEFFIEETHPTSEGEEENMINPLEELRQTTTLSSILKDWATLDYEESKLMQSKDVVVFLLVGLDESRVNSDVMMLMSCNKKEGKIHLNSVMRDSYTYMETPFGERYTKLNASYANGGIDCLVDTIQRDYKIKIDNYFIVNFKTFVEIVDIIGGIDVDVKQYEANAANLPYWGENTHLNGEQVLMYCRIRKCDADGEISRTRRQRQVISSLIKKAREVEFNQLDDILSSLTEHIKTDCPTAKLVSLGTQALMGKWYNFEIESKEMPLDEHRLDYNGASWVWIVDFPADAVALQKEIFGKTNIGLQENRVTAIDVFKQIGM